MSLRIVASCDAFYGAHSNGKGHTGFVVSAGDSWSFLHARSGKQSVGGTSSTDCEVIALSECIKFCIWMRNVLCDMNIVSLSPIEIEQDNRSCIALIKADGPVRRSKHLLSKIAFIRDQHRSGILTLRWIPSTDILSDLLTKPLQGSPLFQKGGKLLNTISQIEE